MSEHETDQNISATSTTVASDITYSKQRIVQSFLLIWLDVNINQSDEDCQNILAQLQNVDNRVTIFTEPDKCVDFLTEIAKIKVYLVVDGTLGQQLIPLIHDIPQLDTVYMFYRNKPQQVEWSKKWVKIRGMGTEIVSICESLQQAVKQCNHDSISMSFVTAGEEDLSQNLDQLEPLFMYTQIYKEILLEMKHDEQSINDFTAYCRHGDYGSASNITRFEKEYNATLAIWWYTYPSFIYSLINSALRIMEADTIIKMGFFINDLHCQIAELHKKQVDRYQQKPFIVYRGQGFSTPDLEKLQKAVGGLMSFNSFLSTSKKREVSLQYAESALGNRDMVGILFQMLIDPAISSAYFADIKEVSYYETEEEILFSMHTVFRVREIIKLNENNSLYQVKLELTADQDEQLRILTKYIRDEVKGRIGSQRLSILLIKTGQINKSEELFKALLEQTLNEAEKAAYYNNLGYLKNNQGDYEMAIRYHERALEILQNTLPPNYSHLASLYNNIGSVYHNMGEYSIALSFYEKELEILQKNLPPNHPDLATSYNSIGSVYDNMGEYSKALSFYEKAREILQKTLPPNHPDLGSSYNNIGSVYDNMGEYSKALSFYEKALELCQKTLPPNHPHLATSYNNIGLVYCHMEEYSKALSFYEKGLEIRQKTLAPNHPDLATSYNNIGSVYHKMGEYSKALSFYEKALEILQKTLPPNHPHLASSYNNIGSVYDNMREYSKALSFYEKGLEIRQKTLRPNHPHLATSYNSIGLAYCHMEEYSKALSLYEKGLEISQKTLPPNHPDLGSSYNNIGSVYDNMGEYSKALSFYEKALEIRQKTLPPNHSHLASLYNNIGLVYHNMGECSKALSFYEKSLEILQKTLSPNHPDLATSYNNIGLVYCHIGEYSKALSFYEKALEVCQKNLPSNHPDLGSSYSKIGWVYYHMGEYSKALSFYERALILFRNSLRSDHPNIKTVQGNIELLKKKM